VAVVCDTAVLIGADRRDRRVAALARLAAEGDVDLVVPVGCIAQAWRDGARQVALVRFLRGCRERDLDAATARAVGELLGKAAATDVVDASVVVAAGPGDSVLTGDPDDLRPLLDATGSRAAIAVF